MLEEGKEYSFYAEKEAIIPDGKVYMVLKGPDNLRHLLHLLPYKGYGIKKGSKVICKVDRINCRGEIFLEPRHPYYEEGKKYKFEIVSQDIRTDDLGNEIKVFLVKDVLGNILPVPVPDDASVLRDKSFVLLTVERIHKGKPVFQKPVKGKEFKGLRYGKIYDFKVEKITKGLDNAEYFLLTDPFNNRHTISKKYYEHYNICPGTLIKARIIKYSAKSSWKIEPVNPYFKAGEVIDLKLNFFDYQHYEQCYILSLKDNYGFIHFVRSKELPSDIRVKARVKGIRKGKPELVLL